MYLIIRVLLIFLIGFILVEGSINWNGDWASGCDFSTQDLSHVPSIGEDCSKICEQTDGCTHYTWTKYNGGTCWMKQGKVSKNDAIPSDADGIVCGVVNRKSFGINWNGDWAFGCDFTNNDLSNQPSRGEDCSKKCEQTVGCTHFTWTKYNDGTCWMKQGKVSKNDAIPSDADGIVCGVVNGEPGTNPLDCIAYEPFSNSNYPNNVDAALVQTLTSIQNQGFKCIKTYYSQYYGLKIADYAQRFNLKIVLGIKMGESFTESEIQTAIDSCQSFSNIIAIYAGNENLPNTNVQDIIDIKNRVKNAGCNIPFGTVQTIGYLLFNADQNLINQMDWIGYNVYPFFSNLGSDSSLSSLRAQISQMRNKYTDNFSKFLISETGWPSSGGSSPQGNPASFDKAKEYADFFSQIICSGEVATPWVSYFTFFDPVYKTNDPEYERNFGVAYQDGSPKWNLNNLHCD